MSRISLLVADDEPIVRTFLRRYVAERNLPVAQVYEAANGQEAIRLALEHAPDLILLDIRMPGINGLDAAAAILEETPMANVVMVTAYDEFEYARSALRSGVADYLLKPLDPNALAALVEKAVALRMAKRSEKTAAPVRNIHPLVLQVQEYVAERLGEPLRLRDVARAMHMSPSHCSRVFSRYAGESLSDFIARQRLEKALEYLQNTHLSVTDIAVNLGFSSSTYFASWFKRSTGESPLQHRRSANAGKSDAASHNVSIDI